MHNTGESPCPLQDETYLKRGFTELRATWHNRSWITSSLKGLQLRLQERDPVPQLLPPTFLPSPEKRSRDCSIPQGSHWGSRLAYLPLGVRFISNKSVFSHSPLSPKQNLHYKKKLNKSSFLNLRSLRPLLLLTSLSSLKRQLLANGQRFPGCLLY